ncbi:MAG: peptidylprolyl isomerase [Phycisphaeraceae bacterium]
MSYRRLPILGVVVAAVLCGLPASPARAQIVEVTTPLGQMYFKMRPGDAPISVANFLKYITDGDYADSFIHRSAFLFDSGVDVIQGGGYTIDQQGTFGLVPTDPPILNEPGVSNLRGTVAMARSAGVNSATSQWYVNLNDANQVLDTNNEGFTVFADVVQGMDVADAIHNLSRVNIGNPFTQLPLLEEAQPPSVDYDEVVLTTYKIVIPGDTDGDGDIDDTDLGTVFTNYTGPVGAAGGKLFADGDTDFDGDIDDTDLGTIFTNYTGPLAPASVPEPASATLLSLAGLALVRRRAV